MAGSDLNELRARIEGLASAGGEYYLICAHRGDRPVPTDGLRFENPVTARVAARATEQYRQTLRRYDPALPRYDIVVARTPKCGGLVSGRDRRAGFCHRVAAAVFESLAVANHGEIEAAVMEAYLDLAGTLSDPNDLCLCLLETIACELASALSPGAQAAVLADAAGRLPAVTPEAGSSIDTACSHLESVGLLGSYRRSPWSVDEAAGTRSVTLQLSEYALAPHEGRLPTLPLVVALYRHSPDRHPTELRVGAADDGWEVALTVGAERSTDGVANVPIQPEVT